MKFFITHFYNIRFLKPNQIPISTTGGDPAWFHDYKGKDNVFIDKRGIINGIREELFSCSHILNSISECCQKDCPFITKVPHCEFMDKYREYLFSLDFNHLMNEFKRVADDVRKITQYEGEPEIILIVYEHPRVICAERPVIIDLFNRNNVEIKEWIKN